MEKINKRWVLAKRPEGMPEDECWKLEEASINDLDENQILIKVMYLSIDPYMRGRMNDMKSYTEPVAIGEVMTGESVGQVIQSRSEKFQIGDYVAAHLGWQSFIRCNDDNPALMRIYPDLAPIQSFLGPAGMPGRTAYFGLKEVGKVKESDTVVVSAASGAVGSVVGQMAKLIGCKTIGIAGGKKKCDFVKDVMGLDYAIDYKSKTFRDDLSKACSDGIDIYFENVGGEVSKAVAELLNPGARVPICGFISAYNSFNSNISESSELPETPFDIFGNLDPTPEHRFFVVTEFNEKWEQATRELAEWMRQGKIKYKETVLEGIENAPQGLRDVLSGKNFGKQLIKVSD